MYIKSIVSKTVQLVMVVIAICISSCGDTGDENRTKEINRNELLGTWWDTKGGFYTFNSDGTCEWGVHSTYTKWELTKEGLSMTRSDGRIEVLLLELTNNKLYLTFSDGDATEKYVLEKFDSEKDMASVDRSYFIGKWKIALDRYTPMEWELFSNGTCKYYDGVSEGSGSWSYTPETCILKLSASLHYIKNGRSGSYCGLEYKILYVSADEFGGNGFAYKRMK